MASTSNSDNIVKLDIKCRKGDSFDRILTFKTDDVEDDISADTFKMQVKDSEGAVVLSFTMGAGASIADNKLTLSKTAVEMAAVAAGRYTYDLQQTKANGTVKTRVGGKFIVNADVTE